MATSSTTQGQIDSMLRKGVVYSIIWLMGVGSLISIVQAVRAKRLIDRSGGELVGMGKVCWCFIVGGMGLLFWGFVFVMASLNGMTR
jgi:hypothetical protein